MDYAAAAFPTFFDGYPEPMMVFDRESLAIVAVNAAAVHAYGYPRERFLTLTVRELWTQETPEILRLIQTPALGPRSPVPSRHRRADGTVMEVEVVASDVEVEGRRARLCMVRDVTAQRRAEAAQRFLAEAGVALATSLDLDATLRKLAELAVPGMADYCTIHLLGSDGVLRQVAEAHRDPARLPLLRASGSHVTRDLDDPISVIARVARNGRGELIRHAREDGLLSGRGGEPLKVYTMQLRPQAYVIAPMVGRTGAVGILNLTQAESGRRFTELDLELANELGRRAGMAIENARLYEAAREELDQRREAEEALRQSEARFRAIFEATPQAMVLLDVDGRIADANPAARQLLGSTDLRGRDVLSFSDPEDVPFEQAKLASLLTGQIPAYDLEARLQPDDGGTVYARISAFRVDAPGGAPPFLVRSMEDVTERRRSEEAISRLAVVAEDSNEAIFGVSLDGTITTWNTGAERIFGYRGDEVIGRLFFMLVPPERMDAARATLQRANSGERVLASTAPVRKDGSQARVTATLSPIRNASGKVVSLGYVGHDDSERLALEEQLQHAQRLEAVGRLAGGVAHDFNNILTGVKGHCAFLLDSLALGDPRRTEVEEIDRAADRASALTRQLLAFGRRQVLQPREMELNAVVQEMEAMLRRVIGEHIRLKTTLDRDVGAVRADPGQLQQVVLNLVVNARDAMPEGGTLRLSTEKLCLPDSSAEPGLPAGEYAMLTVSDTGAGITADVLPHIFEPFFTTKDVGSGTGLGLATVYGIVTQSGGTVRVESTPGLGSHFRVLLPRIAAAAQAPAMPPAVARSSDAGSETILLVEDEAPVRHVAWRVLRAGGYQVLTAADGEEALAIAQRHPRPIDLLLSDVVLPGIGGRIVAERLKILRPDIRVLFVSGYAEDAVLREGALERGMHFMEKPFSPSELRRRVRTVLDEEI